MRIEATLFPESIDSVRTRELAAERLIHAEIEVLLALLFGLRIVVPENCGFDSWSFLLVAKEALRARDQVAQKSPHSETAVWQPFSVALRPNHPTYRNAVAAKLRSVPVPVDEAEDFDRKGFTLSALTAIDEDREAREELAARVEEGRLDRVEGSAALRSWAECVDRMDRYFDNAFHTAAIDLNLLPNLINQVFHVAEADIAPEYREGLTAIKSGLESLANSGCNFADRSQVYLQGPTILGNKEYEAVLEWVDSCYNRAVGSLAGASQGLYSTRMSAENDYVRTAEVLRDSLINTSLDSYSGALELRLEPEPDDIVSIAEPFMYRSDDLSLHLDWETVWELLLDSQWVDSVSELHLALEADRDASPASSGAPDSAATVSDEIGSRRALEKHISNLTEMLPTISDIAPMSGSAKSAAVAGAGQGVINYMATLQTEISFVMGMATSLWVFVSLEVQALASLFHQSRIEGRATSALRRVAGVHRT